MEGGSKMDEQSNPFMALDWQLTTSTGPKFLWIANSQNHLVFGRTNGLLPALPCVLF